MTLITILGPTASGKTALAARLAYKTDGEIISADSRQVYRGMDIGTGKDIGDYTINGTKIPVHVIDIHDPGYEYNIFEFQKDFANAYEEITCRGKQPILCGGSGMYLESVLKGYNLSSIQKDPKWEESLRQKTDDELKQLLLSYRIPHNTTDFTDRERLIRALAIATSAQTKTTSSPIDTQIFGIRFDRETLRRRITQRLEYRLKNGMIEEMERLLVSGLTPGQLKFYGLEYRYVTMYLNKEIEYTEMFRLLNIAIHQFAKRQMTWFRRMERNGFIIHWLDGDTTLEEKVVSVVTQINLKQ
jgi:tRNA dimethylallyltransferase